MTKPSVLILRAPGTNCDVETAHAFSLAGGDTQRWHVNRLLEDSKRLNDFQVLCIPGGFSYGDDIAAGRILGNQMQHHLAGALEDFRASGKLILGICNGFQVLLKTNMLAPADEQGPTATLTLNESGHFEARWVRLKVEAGKCVFLQGVEEFELPVAHAEGRFVPRDADVFEQMNAGGQMVMRYMAIADCGTQRVRGIADFSDQSETRNPKSEIFSAVPYPDNPNGAAGDVAGICDATGRVLGLMPHPERFVDPTQHPRWTRKGAHCAGSGDLRTTSGEPRTTGDGLRVFQNAVRYFL
jgi:phosphoribosylformylglycinamidine synthase